MIGDLRYAESEKMGSPNIENFRNIKPQKEISPTEALANMETSIKEIVEQEKKYYTDYTDRLNLTPSEQTMEGKWEGERGESKFIPSGETDRSIAAKEALAEKGMDGIEYRQAEPDFSKCAEATVQIENMTPYRPDNFAQADEKCAEQWNKIKKDNRDDWTADDVKRWRLENSYTWHECCDTRTMLLVSRDIHSFFRHSGGVAECKAMLESNAGGIFDE